MASARASVRIAAAGAVLAAEYVALVMAFDTGRLLARSDAWWARLVANVGVLVPIALAVATATVLFAGRGLRVRLAGVVAPERARSAWPWLAAHAASFTGFVALTRRLFGGDAGTPVSGAWVLPWLVAAVAAVGTLAVAALPAVRVGRAVRVLARPLAAGAAVGVVAWAAGRVTGEWWLPLSRATLQAVAWVLRGFVADPVVVPERLIVGTRDFQVQIAPQCSGYEGIGLIWVFLAVYLWTFRRTLRFPRALLLLPIGTVVMWSANVLRIVGLIWVGTTISPAIAVGGFHANSGALILCSLALAFAWGSERSAFFTRPAAAVAGEGTTVAAAYLLPFLVTILAAMAAGLVRLPGFDPLYGLRVVAGGVALYAYRDIYRARGPYPGWSWVPVVAGAVVAVPWAALGLADAAGPDPTSTALATLGPVAAAACIAFRIAGATVVVPLAEELAFRGYLAPRLVDRDFERVRLGTLGWPAVAASSLVFGLLHDRFLAATAAGVVYALAARHRGALSDAVVAHATTNLVLAGCAAATGRWSLW